MLHLLKLEDFETNGKSCGCSGFVFDKKFDYESFEIYVNTWKKNSPYFSSELLEFFMQKFFLFYKFVNNCFLELKIDFNQNF